MSFIGPRTNLLDPKSGRNQKLLQVSQPILSNNDIEKIKSIENYTYGAF